MERMSHRSPDGVIAKTCRINGLNLSDVAYPPNLRQPRHAHKFASFSFVMSGSYVEKFTPHALSRKSSTVVFHPPEESHAVDFETNVRILSVEFDFKRLAAIREHSTVLDAPGSLRTENISYLGRKIYREFQQPDSFSALAIEGLILEILAEAARLQTRGDDKQFPRWLDQTREFLHANFAGSFFVDDIAKIAGVHPVHLSRVFRRKFGCTIGEYVRRLRVEFAERQISATAAPLSEIALAAGFSDQSHLNKTFKSVFGLTPAAHRKISRRG
ncbi:MAG TPA: AraC family transcriptional regulator [Pyrinomonadaceae bacterium]|jgi:AraC family transcriptional regulator|nr:AraC family transcriptional regulator [Pyrinomonadaceae bacterium]